MWERLMYGWFFNDFPVILINWSTQYQTLRANATEKEDGTEEWWNDEKKNG